MKILVVLIVFVLAIGLSAQLVMAGDRPKGEGGGWNDPPEALESDDGGWDVPLKSQTSEKGDDSPWIDVDDDPFGI